MFGTICNLLYEALVLDDFICNRQGVLRQNVFRFRVGFLVYVTDKRVINCNNVILCHK